MEKQTFISFIKKARAAYLAKKAQTALETYKEIHSRLIKEEKDITISALEKNVHSALRSKKRNI